MRISELIPRELIIPELVSRDRTGIAGTGSKYRRPVSGLLSREELRGDFKGNGKGWAVPVVGEGFAIPHGKLRGIDQIIIGFGRSPAGILLTPWTGKPAHYFFVLMAPEHSAGDHLKAWPRFHGS